MSKKIREIFHQVPKSMLETRTIKNAIKRGYFTEALVLLEVDLEIIAETYLGRELLSHGFKPRKQPKYGGGQIEYLEQERQSRHKVIVSLLFDLSLITNKQKEVFDRVRNTRNHFAHAWGFDRSCYSEKKIKQAIGDGLGLVDQFEMSGVIDSTD